VIVALMQATRSTQISLVDELDPVPERRRTRPDGITAASTDRSRDDATIVFAPTNLQ